MPQPLKIPTDLGLPSPEWENECGSSDLPFADCEIVRDQLNVPRSVGAGGIPRRVLKGLVAALAGPRSIICRGSQGAGEVPAVWKLARVIQIFKKGEGRPRELKTR